MGLSTWDPFQGEEGQVRGRTQDETPRWVNEGTPGSDSQSQGSEAPGGSGQ